MRLPFFDVDDYFNKANCKSCIVVGDIILDKYIYGNANRISPEAPIPVINVTNEKYVLGGAANVAANIAGLGIKPYLCGVVGDDLGGNVITDMLEREHIQYIGVRDKNRTTTVKTRVVGVNQQLVRIDEERVDDISEKAQEDIFYEIVERIREVSVVVISDYNKGVITTSFCKRLIELCNRNQIKVIVDPKKNSWDCYDGAYIITPNFKELCGALGSTIENNEDCISARALELIRSHRLEQVLVTRSQYGMTLIKEKSTKTYKAIQHEVYDVSGAGDTVIATIAAFLSAGYSLDESVAVSNYAAGLAVSKSGTYVVKIKEVIDYINHYGTWYEDKIVDKEGLKAISDSWKHSDERIVFTNGCFDLLHIGHIEYLNMARALGSKMIIAVNSDDSVKRLKGPSRPINDERARSLALAALQCVDAVIIFGEDTPEELVKIVRPDYLVKGGDYKPEEIAGRQYAGEVVTIPLTEGYSTTKLIEKIITTS